MSQASKFYGSELYRSDTIRQAIVTGQTEATVVPLRDDDEETIHGQNTERNVDVTVFTLDGFTEFDEKSFFSALASPALSTSPLPPSTPSPPPSPQLVRQPSLASHTFSPLAFRNRSLKRPSSPQLAAPGSSWHVLKHAHRSTHIGNNRRIEWGGCSEGAVNEKGLLLSSVRSTSLDMAVRSRRSTSTERNYFLPTSFTHTLPHSLQVSTQQELLQSDEPLDQSAPKLTLAVDEIGRDQSEDWSGTVIQTIFRTTETEPLQSSPDHPHTCAEEQVPELTTEADQEPEGESEQEPELPLPRISPEELQKLADVTGLNIDLGLDKNLDLDLDNREIQPVLNCVSPRSSMESLRSRSTYSQSSAIQVSPPVSVHAPSEYRSATSTKAETNLTPQQKSASIPWWRKALRKLGRVNRSLRSQRNKF